MIERKLKNYTWVFDEETKEVTLFGREKPAMVTLDKIRWFSLFRFMIRASQRMSVKPRKKKE